MTRVYLLVALPVLYCTGATQSSIPCTAATAADDLTTTYIHDVFQNLNLTTSRPLANAPFGENLFLSFDAHDTHFEWNMTLLRDLFADNAEIILDQNDEGENKRSPTHIAYAAMNVTDGFARVTMLSRDNIQMLLKVEGHTYVTTYADDHWSELTQEQQRQEPSLLLSRTTLEKEGTHLRRRLALERMTNCPSVEMEIQIGIAADAGFTSRMGGSTDTETEIVNLLNKINAVYYAQIGVYLRIGALLIRSSAGGEKWNKMPQLANGGGGGCGTMTDMTIHLGVFSEWTESDAVPSCDGKDCALWHLLTDCGDGGYAWVDSVCYPGRNSGVTTYIGSYTWVLMAHEIGHNFGGRHTDTGIMRSNVQNTGFVDTGDICTAVAEFIKDDQDNNCFSTYQGTVPTEPPRVCDASDSNIGNCCSETQTCDIGQGDCDDDGECLGSLKCGNNNCLPDFGWGGEKRDCCFNPTTPTLPPTPTPTPTPTDRVCDATDSNVGNCCSKTQTCDIGQGDCDRDSECLEGLKCGTNNCRRDFGWGRRKRDCCYQP